MKQAFSLFLICAVAVCAPAGDEPSFEVASIRLTDGPQPGDWSGCSGGPGTRKPRTWICRHATLRGLLFLAYDLELYQYNPPEWMSQSRVRVEARVPDGTSAAEFQLMQQNLLKERYRLALHWEEKEMTVYELTVGKNGPKLKASAPDAPEPELQWSYPAGARRGPDRYPQFPEGTMAMMGVNGYMRWRSANVSMKDLAKVLRGQLRGDVLDHTGLDGKYDMDLYWQERPIEFFPAAPPFDRPIEKVLQESLGLQVKARKGVTRVVVVDHVEREPLEN